MELAALLRRLGALVLVAVACPVALFGGALLGCATRGLSASCAIDGILVSPVLLAGAGLGEPPPRAPTGLGFVMLAVLPGMVAIPVVASIAGNPVPIDPVQGVIATLWFMPPVLIGYGVGRGLARLRARPGRVGRTRPRLRPPRGEADPAIPHRPGGQRPSDWIPTGVACSPATVACIPTTVGRGGPVRRPKRSPLVPFDLAPRASRFRWASLAA